MAEASSDADATTIESFWVVSAVLVRVVAAASSSVDAEDTVCDDLADRGLELVGELLHVGLALNRSDMILLCLGLGLLPRFLLGLDLELLDRSSHGADLVPATEARQHDGKIAFTELFHACDERNERPGDADENKYHGGERDRGTNSHEDECGEPGRRDSPQLRPRSPAWRPPC